MEEALSDAAAAIPQPARCSNILDRFMVHIYCLFIYALLFAHALPMHPPPCSFRRAVLCECFDVVGVGVGVVV